MSGNTIVMMPATSCRWAPGDKVFIIHADGHRELAVITSIDFGTSTVTVGDRAASLVGLMVMAVMLLVAYAAMAFHSG